MDGALHYYVMTKIPPNMPSAKWFWAQVDRIKDGCWEWQGPRTPKGYGLVQRRARGREFQDYAHRVAWTFSRKRAIPKGRMVCHSCDNPPCCRPSHLFLGNASLNALDYIRKFGPFVPAERRSRGESHPRAKLTDDQVQEIRRLYPRYSYSQLGARFGVNKTTIGRIVTKKTRRLP